MPQKEVDPSYAIRRESLTMMLIGGPQPDSHGVLASREFPCWCFKEPDRYIWVLQRDCAIMHVAMRQTFIQHVTVQAPARLNGYPNGVCNVFSPPLRMPVAERFDLNWKGDTIIWHVPVRQPA